MFYFQGKIVQLGIENSDLDWDMLSDGSYSNDVELGPWEREMVIHLLFLFCFMLYQGEMISQAETDYADDDSMDALDSAVKGFVPMDRLAEETEDWTALPLLQDDEE